MAAKGSYTVSIKLVDDVTKGIGAINKKIAAAQAPFNRLNAQFSKLGKLTGITKATESLSKLGTMAAKTGLAVAGISGVASVAGVYELAKSFGVAGINLANMSHSLGQSAESLMGMQNAARLTGVSADSLNGGLLNLSDTLQDAVSGRNTQALQMFQVLGVNIRKSTYEAKSAAEVLPQLADAIAKLDDKPALQRKLARDLGVENLLPYLRKGAKGIQEYNAEVTQFNRVNKSGMEASQRLYNGFTKLSEAGEGFGYTIAQVLEPVLTPLVGALGNAVGKLSGWIQANQKLIDQKLTQWLSPILDGLDRFSKWIEHADFDKVAKQVEGFGHELKLIGEISLAAWAIKQVAAISPLVSLLAMIPGSGVAAVGGAIVAGGAVAITGAGIGGGNSGTFRVPRPSLTPTNWSSYKNNNPLNLAYHDGQPNVQGANGRWGVYKNAADGLGAGLNQMIIDANKGFDTIAKEVAHRSPPGENDTRGMISRIAGMMGMDANATLNYRDPETAKKFLRAVTVGGEGNANPSDSDLDNAFKMNQASDPYRKYSQTHSINGNVSVDVAFSGAPAGTRANATANGSAFASAPTVSLGMPSLQMP